MLAHCLSESLAVDFVLETVRGLLEAHGGELKTDTRLHSDQRCHYTSVAFTELLQNSGLRQSMSRRGNCWDNAPQESFLGHMKDEVDIRRCESFDGVRVQIKVWMDYYTRERTLPVGLKKLSPDEYWEYTHTGKSPLKEEGAGSPTVGRA